MKKAVDIFYFFFSELVLGHFPLDFLFRRFFSHKLAANGSLICKHQTNPQP
jgi:hypothetical protein